MYMKHLTKEELDHIATSLIENPSYETIKKLDIEFESKYNIGGPVVSASTSSNVKPIPLFKISLGLNISSMDSPVIVKGQKK